MATCKYCAATIPANSVFCKKCGKKDPIFSEADTAQFSEKEVIKDKWFNRTGILILWLVFFFPVGLFGVYRNQKWPMFIKLAVFAFFASAFVKAMIERV